MKIPPKHLVLLATVAFLFSMSLATAVRSFQAEQGSTPEAQITYGDNYGTLNDQGQLRTYYLYTPKSYNPDRPMPLVLVLHGHGGSGHSIAEVTRFNDLADKNGFIAVYPDAIDLDSDKTQHNWHLRKNSTKKVEVDDVSFISALIDHLQQIRKIDNRRIYVAGFSKGAILTQDLACELPDKIAAFASVAGSIPTWLKPKCQPQVPTSMLMINGTNDQEVHYQGDPKDLSIPETAKFWQTKNQCAALPEVQSVANSNSGKRFKVNISRSSSCRDGSEVILAAIVNGGHLWPGGASQDAAVNQFNAQLGFNASQTIWDFFQRHSLP